MQDDVEKAHHRPKVWRYNLYTHTPKAAGAVGATHPQCGIVPRRHGHRHARGLDHEPSLAGEYERRPSLARVAVAQVPRSARGPKKGVQFFESGGQFRLLRHAYAPVRTCGEAHRIKKIVHIWVVSLPYLSH